MCRYSTFLFVVLLAAFLTQPSGLTLVHAQAANEKVEFHSVEAFLTDARKNLRVGAEYAFDLCRGIPATQAEPGRLNPSDSTCGDAHNPSATVSGGNPPYHFQLEPMGGFPPMGMWVDLNGVLRGTPKNGKGADFSVCAVDMSGRSDCQRISIKNIPSASGGKGARMVLGAAGVGLAVAAGLYAGQMASDLAAGTAGGTCVSSRSCIVNVMSAGCSCAGSVKGDCSWTGAVAGLGQSCTSVPCESGLSCNNGRCEGSSGRCPF